jgi:uncharacterized Fe-S center protein
LILRNPLKSKVYFTSAVAHEKKENNLLNRLGRLYDAVGFNAKLKPLEHVAIKTHFGEGGTTRYLRPLFLSKLVESVAMSGARPFLTDSNTFYVDRRHNAYEHLLTTMRHGFYPPAVNVPIIIADGLIGADCVKVPINGKHFQSVGVASAIRHANAILVATHFKGHVVTGFGGSLKNVGIGCTWRPAKLSIHGARAKISERCTKCGACLDTCHVSAISGEGDKPVVDIDLCDGCGMCTLACYSDAIDPDWRSGSLYTKEETEERMVECVAAALKGKEGKRMFVNFVMDVTPECDCEPWADLPIIPDVGILAGEDIVAVDQASVDLVNGQRGLRESLLKSAYEPGEDKFRALNGVDWGVQLSYAEELGLGTRSYELIDVQ